MVTRLLPAVALAVALASAPEPAHVVRLPPAPGAMHVMVQVTCDGGLRGWATPYGASLAVTVAHITDDCAALGWEGQFKRGHLTVIKRRHQNAPSGAPLHDVAVVRSDVPFDFWATTAKRIPENGELVWFRLFLPGPNAVDSPAWYLGADGRGHVHAGGVAHPGSSGSGWFTANGELVAVHNGTYGPESRAQATAWGTPIGEALR